MIKGLAIYNSNGRWFSFEETEKLLALQLEEMVPSLLEQHGHTTGMGTEQVLPLLKKLGWVVKEAVLFSEPFSENVKAEISANSL